MVERRRPGLETPLVQVTSRAGGNGPDTSSAADRLDVGTVRAALNRGREALDGGHLVRALAWFGRAARLAPGDSTVELLRALALLEHDLAACREAVGRLIARNPRLREAYVLRVACEARDGQHEKAGGALADLLVRFAPPDEDGFHRLADRVAALSGSPGWLGLAVDGTVSLSVGAARRIELWLDGTPVTFSKGLTAGVRRATLPEDWRRCRELVATRKGAHLIGSPLAIAPFALAEGVAGWLPATGIDGWAYHPADPDRPVLLDIALLDDDTGRSETMRLIARDAEAAPGASDDSGRRRLFHLDADRLPGIGRVSVRGPDGRDLAGSPVMLGRERAAAAAAAASLGRQSVGGAPPATAPPDAWRPLPTMLLGAQRPAVRPVPARRRLDVVIPVYRHAADLVACLASLRGALPPDTRVVVVDDHSPEPAVLETLRLAEAAGEVLVLRLDRNRGFPTAANTGLRFSSGAGQRDVLLLNSDTLVPPGAIERLVTAAYSSLDIGSVTPMTNDGTILSYPSTSQPNPVPDLAEARALDTVFQAAHGDELVEIPTAVGFCMFIRHDCVAEVGLLREDAFAQGYGEENDWCLRASHLGWRHVAAAGVFVGHVGARSFGAVKSYLVARNMAQLNRLHPGYDALIADFIARDPLAPVRRGADLVRWRERRREAGAVVLVTHDLGGGVARHVSDRCAAIRAEGRRPIVLRPGETSASCLVSEGGSDEFANLAFGLPSELDALMALLAEDRPTHVELHHLIGHAPELLDLARRLGLEQDVYVHDYAQWCPRVTLVSHGDRYCGEPVRVEECIACVADLGGRIEDPIGVVALRDRSAKVLRDARAVIVPSEDAARRVRRHFPFARPVIGAWEDEASLLAEFGRARRVTGQAHGVPARIVVAGAIGLEKGYDIVLACARDAARRNLAIEFVVVGYTMDDSRLLDTGRAFVTGRYEEAEGPALVAAQNATVGFIPSIWPETWCYALSTLWRGGMPAVAFDIGAQAERIRRAGVGSLLPMGLPAPRINDFLLRSISPGA